ncbi:hypothetical protein ACTXT7_004100 [Hymenolepis weldensis]
MQPQGSADDFNKRELEAFVRKVPNLKFNRTFSAALSDQAQTRVNGLNQGVLFLNDSFKGPFPSTKNISPITQGVLLIFSKPVT